MAGELLLLKIILFQPPLQGPWSDSDIRRSKQLTYEEKKELRTGVGEWWMLYDDFTQCFTHLTICHPKPETKKRGSRVTWEETSFKVPTITVVQIEKRQIYQGSWDKKSGGSGADGGIANLLKNPQFIFKLPKSGSHEVNIINHPHLSTCRILGEHCPDAEWAPAAAR